MPRIALFGLGYWGKNLLRNIHDSQLWNEIYIYDKDIQKVKQFKKLFPAVIEVTVANQIFQDEGIQSVVIATTPDTHYDLAKQCLQSNKHILVEKPFTTSLDEAKELHEIAQERGLKIMVDYTFLYTGAVEKIKDLYHRGELGKLLYVDSSRINLGMFQSDINVVWDLACHDLAIIKYITGLTPTRVQANGISHFSTGFESIAYTTLYYPNNVIVHLNCSWISPVKIRHMLIAGDQKMIVYNDIEPTDKVKVYDSAITKKWNHEDRAKTLVDYRHGDIYSPKLDNTEALKKVIQGFYDYSNENGNVTTDAIFAIDILIILEGIQKSLDNHNCIVEL